MYNIIWTYMISGIDGGTLRAKVLDNIQMSMPRSPVKGRVSSLQQQESSKGKIINVRGEKRGGESSYAN